MKDHLYTYRVKYDGLEILDGDTIRATIDLGFGISKKEKIRLADIDTPEVRTSDKIEKKFGELSANKLKELIENSEDLYVKTTLDKQEDTFGRVLGTLYCDDLNVNKYLVDNYYAVDWVWSKAARITAHNNNRAKLLQLGMLTDD